MDFAIKQNGIYLNWSSALLAAVLIVIVFMVICKIYTYLFVDNVLYSDLSTMETIMGLKYTTTRFINRLIEKYHDQPEVLTELTILASKHQPWNYRENYREDGKTSYTVNKGTMFLCVKDPTTGRIHDTNTLIYVTLHELAHVMTESFGHSDIIFWQNFKFLLQEAVMQKIYNPVDYGKYPEHYCSILIEDNPLFMSSIKSRF